MLGLLMALESVSVLVAEREGRLKEAERDVAASLASEQTLMGPALQRRCQETWESTQGTGAEQRTVTRAAGLRPARGARDRWSSPAAPTSRPATGACSR